MTIHATPSDDGAPLDDATRNAVNDTLVLRYWLDEASPDERATVERWFAEHPEARLRYDQLRQGLRAGGWTTWSPQTIAERTVTILQATGAVAVLTPRRGAPRRSVLAIRSLLAGIASVALFGIGWYALDRREATPGIVGGSVYTTANGERATITLADQSTVTLSVGSRLEIPADYAAGHRTLRLTGEALFSVAHHHAKPFTVIAGPSVTRVLGTNFVVRHYPTDTSATVSVRDGKVMVGTAILTALQTISVNRHGTSVILPASTARFGFATGRLALDGTLVDAIPDLNRWYDADIRLGDASLGARQIVLECGNGSIADLEAILRQALDLRVVRDGRTLTLYSRGS